MSAGEAAGKAHDDLAGAGAPLAHQGLRRAPRAPQDRHRPQTLLPLRLREVTTTIDLITFMLLVNSYKFHNDHVNAKAGLLETMAPAWLKDELPLYFVLIATLYGLFVVGCNKF